MLIAGLTKWLGRLRACLAVAACVLACAAAVAQDVEKVYDFDIHEDTLGAALAAIARQTDLVVLHPHELAGKTGMKPVVGRYTVREAIGILFRDTQFSGGLTEHGVIYISISGNEQARHGEKKMDRRVRKSLWASVVALLSGSAAHSQDAGNIGGQQLEEIIVTAQKRAERLVETPQSVSVLSAETLSKLGATQFRDFATTVPGLNFQTGGAGFNQLSLRGVTTGYDITPSVGNVVDDVPYGSSSAFARGAQLALDVGLFDIDRIEVLKGPQGTLYGASTMGGLIKYVTRQPDVNEFGVELQTGVSETTGGDINYLGAAVVNAPLVADKAALRVSGFHSHDGGYVDNVALGREDVNASKIQGGRVDLAVLPTDSLTLRLSAVLQDIERDGTPTVDHTIDRVPLYGELRQFRLIPETFDQRFRLVSATATYDAGSVELTSISSYQTIRSHFIVDDSPLLVPVLQQILGRTYSAAEIDNGVDTDKFTQEVRLASTGSRPVEWLIGGFYTREDSENRQQLLLLDAARQPAINDLFNYRTPSKYQEYAAFGNLTYYFTDKFDVTTGVRYARNEQEYTQDASGLLIGAVPKRTDEENVYTYLANARYRFTPNATAYARFATGYRPGGPNAVSIDPITGQPNAPESFKADTSKSYELGFKAQLPGGALAADVAVYYIDWNDLQQLTTTASGVSYYANANAGAEIKGAELTLSARLVGALTASAAFAYQDASMSDAEPILGASKGERLPNVPRFTAAVSADYVFQDYALQPSVGLTFRSISDRMASFDANTTVAQYQFDSYETLDARAGFLIGVTEIQLYVRNISDEHGQLVIPSGVSSAAGPIEVSTLQPRTFGVTATLRF